MLQKMDGEATNSDLQGISEYTYQDQDLFDSEVIWTDLICNMTEDRSDVPLICLFLACSRGPDYHSYLNLTQSSLSVRSRNSSFSTAEVVNAVDPKDNTILSRRLFSK